MGVVLPDDSGLWAASRRLQSSDVFWSEQGWRVPGVQRMAQIYGMEGQNLADGAIHSVIGGIRPQKYVNSALWLTTMHTWDGSNKEMSPLFPC